MNEKVLNLKIIENNVVVPKKGSVYFNPYHPKADFMITYSALHAAVQQSGKYVDGSEGSIIVDINQLGKYVRMHKRQVKDMMTQLVQYKLGNYKRVDGDIYQFNFPNFKSWTIDSGKYCHLMFI